MASQNSEKKVMLVAIDAGEPLSALEWTLDHLLRATIFELFAVNVRPYAFSGLQLDLPPNRGNHWPGIDNEYIRRAVTTLKKAEKLCWQKSIRRVGFQVWLGDPKHTLCAAVRYNHASILVMGSCSASGGTNNSGSLGRVAEFCPRQADCNVMIVRKPTLTLELPLAPQNSQEASRSPVSKVKSVLFQQHSML